MMRGDYNEALVLVSILVAIGASYTALALAERVASAGPRTARWWIAGGAFAMGTGIWSMHFIGMLAFRLPIPLGYDLATTLASWALPVIVSSLALRLLSQPSWSTGTLALSAVLFGLGINAMHYVGMAAMQMDPPIAWDWALVAASIAIAILAAAASLWIGFRLRRADTPRVWLHRGAAAVLMGAAIVGMHYTGMAAAGFPEGAVCRAAEAGFELGELAMLVIVATFAVLAIALLITVYDARLEAHSHGLALAERVSRERQHLLEAERSARSEAERLSALKDQFLATLSHELRTPLNAILGWTQLLRHRRDPSVLDRGLETIERNARVQAQLIEDLLDMSRIVSGQVRLETRRMELAEVIEAAVETARPAALAKDIELQVELDRAIVWGDAARLQQVMWNLLMNAVKFTPNRGRVTVTLRRRGEEAVATVTDTGIGIDPSFLPFVFDRFRQADASTTRRHGGLGIGLSIVQQLVQLHGGTVQASSAGPGHGAEFSVQLPLAGDAGSATHPRGLMPSISRVQRLPDLHGVRVLVVDDDEDARQLASQILQDCGAEVALAATAPEALEQLQRQRPQVLVSDIGMPEVDGFQLIRQVRSLQDAALAEVPALALTAFTRAQDEQRAVAEGYDRFLRKPVEAGEFVEAVAAAARTTRA